ncbi:hypothetical protein BD779DRAFT_1788851 [Infundibulicybe gibba]|nr:hypothetical protein BD779DRAFT_1788851 [Infundibulicybe gibba]
MAEKHGLLVDFPPEIISEIFIQCLPWMNALQRGSYPFQNTRPPIAFDLRDAPLLLMRICRRWRSIAEATPILWTRLPNTQSTKALGLYKMYIKNSGEAPLWTHLTLDSVRQEVADILIPHSHRWEHLTLTFGARPDDLAIQNLPVRLPGLKYLQLKQAYSVFPRPIRRLNAAVFQLPKFLAPLLKSVDIPSSKVLGLNLPWSQLTHYSGEFNLLQDAVAFLSLCTNLETLHLRNPNQSVDLSGAAPVPLHLPRLQDLLLVNEHLHLCYYHSLIDCLILPALEKVCISVDDKYPILEALRQCVVRSSPNGVPRLRSAEIQCSRRLNRLDLQELSLVAPCIQELRISRPSSEALFAMGFHSTTPLLFPCLQYLALVNPFLKGYELVDIIKSRCHPPPSELEAPIPLRRVEVMCVEAPTPMVYAMSRRGMIQPFHEEFQDVAEDFTDDPNFKQMCERLNAILTVREMIPGSQKYQLPSHWGKLMDPLLCFFEFSDAVFTFFENYEVYHPLLLSRYPVASLLQEFLRGNLGPNGLLRTRQQNS